MSGAIPFSLALSQPRPLREHIFLRPLPLLPPLHNPPLEGLALDSVYLAVSDHFKHGGQRHFWKAHGAVLFGFGNVEMGRIESAGGLEVQAMPPPIRVADGHGTPLRHGNRVAR